MTSYLLVNHNSHESGVVSQKALSRHLHSCGYIISRTNTKYDTMTRYVKAIYNAATVPTFLLLEEVIAICTKVIICLSAYVECLYDVQDFEISMSMYINKGQSYFTASV